MIKDINQILQWIEYVEIDQDVDFMTALRVVELAFKLHEQEED